MVVFLKRVLRVGIPQGSCLGSLLYAIFTNDLPFMLKHAKLTIYADDASVYAFAKSLSALTLILNNKLEIADRWVLDHQTSSRS